MIAFQRTTRNSSRPAFVVDHTTVGRDTGRQIDWDLLDEQYQYGAFTVQLSAASAALDTTLDVIALPFPVEAGTVIRFGVDEFARVTTDALAGAVVLLVDAIPIALEINDVGYVDGNSISGKQVLAGTLVDLLTNGKIVPSALNAAGATAYGLMITNADENSPSDAASGYGVYTQGFFYENLLPESTGTPKVANSTHKTELLARGGSWMFTQFEDNTA